MKKLSIFLLGLLLFSCEKVIEVDVNDADEQTVVEAVLTDQPFSSFIALTKSAALFEESDFETIDSASVEIIDQNGTVTVFQQVAPGLYVNPGFVTQEGYTYSLTIITDVSTFTATASTPKRVELDTSYIDYDYKNPFGEIEPRVHIKFTDDPTPESFYRAIAYKNGEKDGGINLYDDELTNGELEEDNLDQFDFEVGDTIAIDFLSVNPDYHEYMRVLDAISGNPFSSAPGNPPTNIESDAKVQGYFGVFRLDRDTLYVTQ